jgi:hypothetical protein
VVADKTQRLLFIAALMLLTGCQVQQDLQEAASSPGAADGEIFEESPLIVAQILEVPKGAKVGDVHGKCTLVHRQRNGKPMRRGQLLHHGDGIAMDPSCIVTIVFPNDPQSVRLTRENGRFFRIEMKK